MARQGANPGFRRQNRLAGKGAGAVDGGVGEDTGEQAPAPVKDEDKQEPEADGPGHLAEVRQQLHAAAVHLVEQMAQAEGDAGDDSRLFDPLRRQGQEQQAPEAHLLQKAHAEHLDHIAGRIRQRKADRRPVPEAAGGQDQQGEVPEEPPGREGGPAKPVAGKEAIFPDPAQQRRRQREAEKGMGGVRDADPAAEGIGEGLEGAVEGDPDQGKGQLTLSIQCFHLISSRAARRAPR